MSQDNEEVIRLWWAGFNEHGVAPIDLCAERIELKNPPEFPQPGPYQGHAGMRQWAAETFDTVDEPRVEVEEVIETGDGETVVMVLRAVGRWKHMDMDADIPWAAVGIIRDGKLVSGQGYMSKAEALEAVGLRK